MQKQLIENTLLIAEARADAPMEYHDSFSKNAAILLLELKEAISAMGYEVVDFIEEFKL